MYNPKNRIIMKSLLIYGTNALPLIAAKISIMTIDIVFLTIASIYRVINQLTIVAALQIIRQAINIIRMGTNGNHTLIMEKL